MIHICAQCETRTAVESLLCGIPMYDSYEVKWSVKDSNKGHCVKILGISDYWKEFALKRLKEERSVIAYAVWVE